MNPINPEPPSWLDIHAHFQLPSTPESQSNLLTALHDLKFFATEAPTWDPKAIISYLDRAGIAMQMLSYVPIGDPSIISTANDFAASIVEAHPTRFGLLAALPVYECAAALAEIKRIDAYGSGSNTFFPPDGYALTTVAHNGITLADPSLNPLWEVLNARKAVIHVHPGAFAPAHDRPAPLIEVAFDTTRTITDMIYNTVFTRFPSITFVLAHAGGCLPSLSGRLKLLGAESWVPNPSGVTAEDIERQCKSLWVDTAASAETALLPAVRMVGLGQCVYGADCGVPCSTERTMEENRRAVVKVEIGEGGENGGIGINGWGLFPRARERAAGGR